MQLTYRNATEALPNIMTELLEYGEEVGSRNGRVKELLNAQIALTHPWFREILNPGRGANVFAQIAETAWVLAGRNDIEWLSAYLPRAKDFSDDGETWRGGYGPRIRGGHFGVDQLQHVVDLLQNDPLSRRAVIGIYDPVADTEPGKDIPCNDFLQFQSRLGALHLTVTTRSNDAMWGWSGINAFEWSALQEIVAGILGLNVGPLVFNIGSLHLYEQHWNRASKVHPEPMETSLQPVRFDPDRLVRDVATLDTLLDRFFIWESLCRKGEVTYEMLEDWEEPMFKAWAAAIAFYWTRLDEFLNHLGSTTLAVAVARTPTSLFVEPVTASRTVPPAHRATRPQRGTAAAFYDFVCDMHRKKHASYGDSWKKRGEVMSILPNIARKIDRLGVGDEFDSSADTVIDLWVYLAKYLAWLRGDADPVEPVEKNLLVSLTAGRSILEDWRTRVPEAFNDYAENMQTYSVLMKTRWATNMLEIVAPIAFDLWYIENEYRGADAD